jgi:4-hydroxy-3-methylbut-2-en-1-yl diphosphate reductase
VTRILIAAPLRIEAMLVRRPARGKPIRATGMGPARARAAAGALLEEPGDGLMVLGFCGGLDSHSEPGEVIVADEVAAAADEGHDPRGIPCMGAERLERAMAGRGLQVRRGRIVCVSRIALGERRAELLADGALAVDMESAWLAAGAGGRPFCVVRVVLDSPSHELLRPRAVVGAVRAARALRRAAAAAVHDWDPAG